MREESDKTTGLFGINHPGGGKTRRKSAWRTCRLHGLLCPFMSRPVVASYCTTFLKREMLHIYRQVSGLREFSTFVMTKSRENADVYPFDDVEVLARPRINFLQRFYKKYVAGLEPVFYRGEYDQLDSLMARRQADLLHVYFGHTGVHLLPFVKHWPRPSLVSFHGMDIMPRHDEPGYTDRLRELLQVLPMVLARSSSLARNLVALGCPEEKIRLNRTGIPMDAFPPLRRDLPADGAWRFVQASRLIEKKGLDVALEAFAVFRQTHPSTHFTIAGDGPLRSALETQVQNLGLSSAVTFTGFLGQSDLGRLYRESHVFVHPSQTTKAGDQEGVPNAMLEAMATGLPVVATQHGGIPEAVTDGEDGLLTEERSTAQLIQSFLRLCDDGALYAALSARAAESVREKFEHSRSIAQLEACYRELIS